MNENKNFSFAEIIEANSINLASTSNISFVEVFGALIFSMICGLIIAWTYKSTFQGVFSDRLRE